MKYIISSTIIFLMLIHPVFAQNEKVEEVSSDVLNFFEKIYEKTILPVKCNG